MKYAVIKVINGAYAIHSEGWTDLEEAIINWHGCCSTLHNAQDVETACVIIADENLDVAQGYKEFIDHRPKPEPNEE
jgi:hypothetical protein